MPKKFSRNTPTRVQRILRQEVGFRCPVPDCGCPYLTWHHFDPPWNIENHYRPDGMIALCQEHHSKADTRSFTIEQLRQFKTDGAKHAQEVIGKFDWMRNRLLGVVGGNFFWDVSDLLRYDDTPLIWFKRDRNGYLLLNLQMKNELGVPRVLIHDNVWTAQDKPVDIECPPSGRIVNVKYPDGDGLGVEFFEIDSYKALIGRYSTIASGDFITQKFEHFDFPLTSVEVHLTTTLGTHKLRLTSQKAFLPKGGGMTGCLCEGCGIKISRDGSITI